MSQFAFIEKTKSSDNYSLRTNWQRSQTGLGFIPLLETPRRRFMNKKYICIVSCSAQPFTSRNSLANDIKHAICTPVRAMLSHKHGTSWAHFYSHNGVCGLLLKVRWDTYNSEDLNSLSGLSKMITTHEEVENSMKQTIRKQSTSNITVGERAAAGKNSHSRDWKLAELGALHSSKSSSSIQTAFLIKLENSSTEHADLGMWALSFPSRSLPLIYKCV